MSTNQRRLLASKSLFALDVRSTPGRAIVVACALAASSGCALGTGEDAAEPPGQAREAVAATTAGLNSGGRQLPHPRCRKPVLYRASLSPIKMFAPVDFDGDGRADLSENTYWSGVNRWYMNLSSQAFAAWGTGYYTGYANTTSVIVPADYDGDCKTDLAVKDNATGHWKIDFSSNGLGAFDRDLPGYGGAVPLLPADYDGDGKYDISERGSDGTWYIDFASNGFGAWNLVLPGYPGDGTYAVPADYDRDGKADIAVYSGGVWLIDYAADGFNLNFTQFQHADGPNAVPVPADYDGDGKADLAVKDGTIWYIDYSSDPSSNWNVVTTSGYAGSTGIPVPADYDGDGKTDIAVIAADGTWLIDFASAPAASPFGVWDWAVSPAPLY